MHGMPYYSLGNLTITAGYTTPHLIAIKNLS